MNIQQYLRNSILIIDFLEINSNDKLTSDIINLIKNDERIVLILKTNNLHGMVDQRNFICKLINNKYEKSCDSFQKL